MAHRMIIDDNWIIVEDERGSWHFPSDYDKIPKIGKLEQPQPQIGDVGAEPGITSPSKTTQEPGSLEMPGLEPLTAADYKHEKEYLKKSPPPPQPDEYPETGDTGTQEIAIPEQVVPETKQPAQQELFEQLSRIPLPPGYIRYFDDRGMWVLPDYFFGQKFGPAAREVAGAQARRQLPPAHERVSQEAGAGAQAKRLTPWDVETGSEIIELLEGADLGPLWRKERDDRGLWVFSKHFPSTREETTRETAATSTARQFQQPQVGGTQIAAGGRVAPGTQSKETEELFQELGRMQLPPGYSRAYDDEGMWIVPDYFFGQRLIDRAAQGAEAGAQARKLPPPVFGSVSQGEDAGAQAKKLTPWNVETGSEIIELLEGADLGPQWRKQRDDRGLWIFSENLRKAPEGPQTAAASAAAGTQQQQSQQAAGTVATGQPASETGQPMESDDEVRDILDKVKLRSHWFKQTDDEGVWFLPKSFFGGQLTNEFQEKPTTSIVVATPSPSDKDDRKSSSDLQSPVDLSSSDRSSPGQIFPDQKSPVLESPEQKTEPTAETKTPVLESPVSDQPSPVSPSQESPDLPKQELPSPSQQTQGQTQEQAADQSLEKTSGQQSPVQQTLDQPAEVKTPVKETSDQQLPDLASPGQGSTDQQPPGPEQASPEQVNVVSSSFGQSSTDQQPPGLEQASPEQVNVVSSSPGQSSTDQETHGQTQEQASEKSLEKTSGQQSPVQQTLDQPAEVKTPVKEAQDQQLPELASPGHPGSTDQQPPGPEQASPEQVDVVSPSPEGSSQTGEHKSP